MFFDAPQIVTSMPAREPRFPGSALVHRTEYEGCFDHARKLVTQPPSGSDADPVRFCAAVYTPAAYETDYRRRHVPQGRNKGKF